MKYILIFLFLFLFLSCTYENKNNIVLKKDTTNYDLRYGWTEITGIYINDSHLINICGYKKAKISIINFTKSQIDTLLKHKIMVSSYLEKTEKINYKEFKADTAYTYYYEITHLSSNEKIKTVGKLYYLGYYCSSCLGGGEVFISDTTQKYGWFIVQTPPHLKPPAYFSKPVLKNLKITSIDPKAEPLCDEYIRGSNNVYRVIKDEELIKPTKIKD